jgi:hypothetical protein
MAQKRCEDLFQTITNWLTKGKVDRGIVMNDDFGSCDNWGLLQEQHVMASSLNEKYEILRHMSDLWTIKVIPYGYGKQYSDGD